MVETHLGRRRLLDYAAGALVSAGLVGTAAAAGRDGSTGGRTGDSRTDDGRTDTPPREPTVFVHGATKRDGHYHTTVDRRVRFELSVMSTARVGDEGPRVTDCTWTVVDGPTLSGTTAAHEWTEPGTKLVALSVAYADGSTARRRLTVEVTRENRPPVPIPDVSPGRWFDDGVVVEAGQRVTYDATDSEDPDGQVVDATWAFPNRTADGLVVEHEFRRLGPRTVTLAVTDDDGATAEMDLFVFVQRPTR